MRILLIAQNFFPETGATPNRMLSFLESFQEAGHEVTVIAAKPNHPEGVIWKEYRGGWITERQVEGVEVLYTWVYVRPDKGFLSRILHYLTFMVMAVLASLRLRDRYDVVLATSPPLFVGLSGWAISKLKRSKFVFDVRDLWPDLAVAMGELQGESKIRLAKTIERFLYRSADGISAVTASFCKHIERIAGPEKKIAMVANGALPLFLHRRRPAENPLDSIGLRERFVVTFAGNIGICQGMPHVIDAAEILQQQDPGVAFLIIGEGIVKQELISGAKSRSLSNIVFKDRVSSELAADILAASSALLVPLADKEIYKMFIPSKLFDCMASGRPVLLSVDGEARSILESAGAGVYYPAEDGTALAHAIQWLRSHPSEAEAMGLRGQAHAAEQLMRATQAEKMVSFLEDVTGRPASLKLKTAHAA